MTNNQLAAWLKSLPKTTRVNDPDATVGWTAQQFDAVMAKRQKHCRAYWMLEEDIVDLDAKLASEAIANAEEDMEDAGLALSRTMVGYWTERRRYLVNAAGQVWAHHGRDLNLELGYTVY